MKLYRGIFVFALFAVLYFGCKPAPVFPAEPILTFKKYIQSGSDSLQVVFSFTDGDGDIGIAPNSTDSNMVLTGYHKDVNGNWVVIPNPSPGHPNDTLTYEYRIPKLTAGQNGLEGDIYVTITKNFLVLSGEDTLQFNAFLLDQSHHQSAVIRTPEVDLTP
jgi:hypothetical protein